MFVTLQWENYTANLYLFLVIYPLNHEENSEKFERQFQCFFSNSARQLEVPSRNVLSIFVFKKEGSGEKLYEIMEIDIK